MSYNAPVGWLLARMYDRMMAETEQACLHEWRRELLKGATGAVLEVGGGTGANMPFYPSSMSHLVMSEPDPYMRAELRKKSNIDARITLSEDALGQLSAPAASFDAVVSTLVLCSVPDLDAALAELYRVLKPGGRFLFIEHVAAHGKPSRLRWQRIVEPIWKRVAGNCHVTRDTEAAILRAGFVIERIEHDSLRKAMPWVRPVIRGTAIKSRSTSSPGEPT